jgi:hypothetical protein
LELLHPLLVPLVCLEVELSVLPLLSQQLVYSVSQLLNLLHLLEASVSRLNPLLCSVKLLSPVLSVQPALLYSVNLPHLHSVLPRLPHHLALANQPVRLAVASGLNKPLLSVKPLLLSVSPLRLLSVVSEVEPSALA